MIMIITIHPSFPRCFSRRRELHGTCLAAPSPIHAQLIAAYLVTDSVSSLCVCSQVIAEQDREVSSKSSSHKNYKTKIISKRGIKKKRQVKTSPQVMQHLAVARLFFVCTHCFYTCNVLVELLFRQAFHESSFISKRCMNKIYKELITLSNKIKKKNILFTNSSRFSVGFVSTP